MFLLEGKRSTRKLNPFLKCTVNIESNSRAVRRNSSQLKHFTFYSFLYTSQIVYFFSHDTDVLSGMLMLRLV